jgi:WD40 repeat protein
MDVDDLDERIEEEIDRKIDEKLEQKLDNAENQSTQNQTQDQDKDGKLTRRSFLKTLGLGAGGLALSSLGASNIRITDEGITKDGQSLTPFLPGTNKIEQDLNLNGNQIKNVGAQQRDFNQKADLTTNGVLKETQLPDIAITNTNVVANQTERLSLNAQEGDIAIQTDTSQTFILSNNDPTTDTNWKQIQLNVLGAIDGQTITPAQTGTSNNPTTVVADEIRNSAGDVLFPSAESTLLAYGSSDNNVYVHDVGGSFPLDTTLTQATGDIDAGVEFSSDNSLVAYGSNDNNVYIHNVGGGFPLNTTLTESESSVRGDVTFSPNDSLIAHSTDEGNVYVHDVGGSFPLNETLSASNKSRIRGGPSFSPDNSFIAYGNTDGNVYVHDVGGSFPLNTTLTQPNSSARNVSFLSGISMLGYGSSEGNVYLHDVGGGFPLNTTLTQSTSSVRGNVVISPDNSFIAYGDDVGDVFVHDVGGNFPLNKKLTEPDSVVRIAAFSAGNNFFMVNDRSTDGIYIYDVPSFSLNTSFSAATSSIFSHGSFNSV